MKYSFLNPKILLSSPENYSMFQGMVGVKNLYTVCVRDYVKQKTGASVLDIGCDPADILSWFPDVDHLGFDMEERYIEAAKERFGNRGRFVRTKEDYLRLASAVFDDVKANIRHDLLRTPYTRIIMEYK